MSPVEEFSLCFVFTLLLNVGIWIGISLAVTICAICFFVYINCYLDWAKASKQVIYSSVRIMMYMYTVLYFKYFSQLEGGVYKYTQRALSG